MTEPTAITSVTTDADEQDADEDQPPSARPGEPALDVADLRVELNLNTTDTDPPIEGWIDHHLARIAALAGVAGGRVCLALVDDMEMARLHERYKGVPGTTDVLTFDLRSRADEAMDVDVVICRDEAARQAARCDHDARLELLLYAVHGLLHVTGYDDMDAASAQAMHAREDELLAAAGFPSIFAATQRGNTHSEVRETDRE